jgi:hypothetical protein
MSWIPRRSSSGCLSGCACRWQPKHSESRLAAALRLLFEERLCAASMLARVGTKLADAKHTLAALELCALASGTNKAPPPAAAALRSPPSPGSRSRDFFRTR